MASARALRHESPHGVVRARGPARRRSDDDAGPVPVGRQTLVTLYHAADCGLCAHAIDVVEAAQAELGFELELVDIGGDSDLEGRYRVSIPVVEIDGEQAFEYFVASDDLRERLSEHVRRFS